MAEYHFFRSNLNNKFLSVAGADKTRGAPVLMFNQEQVTTAHQQFCIDINTRTLRCKNNPNLVCEIQNPAVDGGRLVLNTFQIGNTAQQWQILSNSIQNIGSSNVLEVTMDKVPEGARVRAMPLTGATAQLFTKLPV